MEHERRRRSDPDDPVAERPEPARSTAASQVLRLQRAGGNRAVTGLIGGARRLQRLIAIQDDNVGTPYVAAIGAVLTAQPFSAWAETIHRMPNVTLHIVVAPEAAIDPQAKQRRKEGVTRVTEIKGQPVQEGARQEDWRRWLAAGDVTITIRLFPTEEDDTGEVKAYLLHELDLHARPMLASLHAIKSHGTGPPTSTTHRAELFAHAEAILEGEDAQHAEYASWIAYLDHAVALGNADKQKGEVDEGSALILSAVNDAMTHAAFPEMAPLLTPQARSALFDNANRIGLAERESIRQREAQQSGAAGRPMDVETTPSGF
jgi:hypothetical protein